MTFRLKNRKLVICFESMFLFKNMPKRNQHGMNKPFFNALGGNSFLNKFPGGALTVRLWGGEGRFVQPLSNITKQFCTVFDVQHLQYNIFL